MQTKPYSRIHPLLMLLLLGLLLTGCATAVPGGTVPGATIPPNGAPAAEIDNPAALNQRQVLAMQLQLDLADVAITAVEAVTWPDQCLGKPNPAELCAAAETPGYRITLTANGEEYIYHTNADGSQVRLAAAPAPQIGETVIEWTGNGDSGCTTALIGADGVAIGRCYEEERLGMPFPVATRATELADFAQTFAPFQADTVAGTVVFTGTGSTTATPAQQRMIAEWARLVQLEAQGGRSGASWGLAFAWHREGGIAGFCDDLTVYVTGEAWATSCRGAQPQDLAHFRLDATQLETLYQWVDTFQSFELEQSDGAVADGMTVTLIFAGAGAEVADEAKQALIVDFAQSLYNEGTQAASTAPSACAQPLADQQMLTQTELGFCLLYPASYSLVQSQPDGVELVIDTVMNHVDPRASIVVEAADGRTLEEVVEGMIADFVQPGVTVDRHELTVGDAPAVMLDNLLGQDINRRVVLVHADRVYSFFFSPIGEEGSETRRTAEALYSLVIESFRLLSESTAPASDAPLSDTGEAMVEAVEIQILESFPVQVRAVVRGQLPDACAFVETTEVVLEGNTFYINMTVARHPNMRCAQMLTPFEQIVPLETAALAAGTYTVQAGEVAEEFALQQ